MYISFDMHTWKKLQTSIIQDVPYHCVSVQTTHVEYHDNVVGLSGVQDFDQ